MRITQNGNCDSGWNATLAFFFSSSLALDWVAPDVMSDHATLENCPEVPRGTCRAPHLWCWLNVQLGREVEVWCGSSSLSV